MWASRVCGFRPLGRANGTSRASPGGLILVRHRRLWPAVICAGKVETRKQGLSSIETVEALPGPLPLHVGAAKPRLVHRRETRPDVTLQLVQPSRARK